VSANQQFVKLPRDVLASPAWQAQSINCRRLLDFLMIEHMRRGGKENGSLIASHRQLCSAGINNGERVTEAIDEAEHLGLVTVERGDRRRPNRFALTWLPLSDGTPANNKWRDNPPSKPPKKVRDNRPLRVRDNPPSKVAVMRDNPPSKPPKKVRDNRPSLYRSSYQGGAVVSVGGEQEEVGTGVPCTVYLTDATGFRWCGKPSVAGGERCPEHVRVQPVTNAASGKPIGQAAV